MCDGCRAYVIETDQLRFELEDVVQVNKHSLDAIVGLPVTVAIERNSVYVATPTMSSTSGASRRRPASQSPDLHGRMHILGGRRAQRPSLPLCLIRRHDEDSVTLSSTALEAFRMRKRSLFLTLLLLATVSTGARAEETIVFLRHGEKPSGGYGQLTCQGFNRSLALPLVLTSKFGHTVPTLRPEPRGEGHRHCRQLLLRPPARHDRADRDQARACRSTRSTATTQSRRCRRR